MKKILTFIALFIGTLISLTANAQEKKEANMPKILVAYYSYSGNTKKIADTIAEKTGGTLFEIKTDTVYPDEYQAMTEQVKKEIENAYRPKLTTFVENIAQYDIIFLGSPNWWGTIPPAVSSFLSQYNFNGKTIIPFISNGGGGVQNTILNITKQCTNCTVIQNGWVVQGAKTTNIESWLKKVTE